MQDFIDDGLAIIAACLIIAGFASAMIVLRPWKRRHRHRKRHSSRKKIDLFAAGEAGDRPAGTDA